jgi:hypothetical protein
VDDGEFVKEGTTSAEIQRQCLGTAGRIYNRQIDAALTNAKSRETGGRSDGGECGP